MMLFFASRYTIPPAVVRANIAESNGMIHKTGDRYTTIRMTATTPRVVSNSDESRVPKAPKRSPRSPPGPVT